MLSFLKRQKMEGIRTTLQDKYINLVIEKAKTERHELLPIESENTVETFLQSNPQAIIV